MGDLTSYSQVIARFSFEYGGVVRHVDEDDEEDSSQIGGIIPGIVSAVNWLSEMNQLSLIQAEMKRFKMLSVLPLLVAMYDSTGTLYWRNTSYARGRRASKINANWFFSSEPFDTNWPSTPSQLFVDALEALITDTLENQVSKN